MSNCSVIPVSQLKSLVIDQSDYIVFGGTFDPFHEGHVTAIRAVMPFFRRLIIAPTEQNPWKNEQPTSIELRAEMAKIVIREENFLLAQSFDKEGVFVSEEKYCYSEELVKRLRNNCRGEIYWLIGEDSKDSVHYWRNWLQLNVTTIVAPVIIDVHAEYIRTGRVSMHPAINSFAKEHKLYGYC